VALQEVKECVEETDMVMAERVVPLAIAKYLAKVGAFLFLQDFLEPCGGSREQPWEKLSLEIDELHGKVTHMR
jgi:hypothetical protein